MKVLHISSALDWRGGEQQVVYLAEELGSIKEVNQVVLCPEGSVLGKKLQKKNIKTSFYFKGFLNHITLAKEIRRLCNENKTDLIHIHDAHSHTSAVLSAVLFGNKTPMVLSRRVDFPVKPNWFSKYKYNHKNIKCIICVSEAVKKILQKDIHNPAIRFSVIYDGIDTTRFSEKPSGFIRKKFNIPAAELLIGNVAAIAPHKDYFTFVDTAELLLKQSIKAKFIIVGDGPEREKVVNYIRSKKLEEYILLTGFVKNIEDVLPELDIFLFTSKTEGLGSSILDACLSKVPVVATRAGGVVEIVKDNETGLLAPVQDPKALAEKIKLLIHTKDLSEKLTNNARAYVQKFSKQNTANQTLVEYKKCISC